MATKTKTKRRFLVSKGNGKMGRMMIWSIPAGDTCPGKSDLCFEACYARKNHFTHKTVITAYKQNYKASQNVNFVNWMVEEINKRPEKLFRIHAAGDFYNAAYVDKWAEIAQSCPDVKFYCYTRSWRIPDIYGALLRFKKLPNVRIWFSIDAETGVPKKKPKRIRYAYMQTGKKDSPTKSSDLVFRDHGLRRVVQKHINGVMVCPPENGVTDITCEQCGYCWRYQTPGERKGMMSLAVVN